jgi:uncharacterized protein
MVDTEEQLARLRQRIAAIDQKYSGHRSAKAVGTTTREKVTAPIAPSQVWPGSEVISNEFGEHLQAELLYPHHRRHGSADIGALRDLPHDLFAAIGAGQIAAAAPERWAFLDTETTGLAGGSGTYAFLIGVGRITPEGFRVRQFFMREYAEERSLLAALNEHLSAFDVLITYNGKSYDQPLLETRYRMTRSRPPFDSLSHLDLLYGARRIWKLRLESCRLVELEQQILGFHREGDIPGHLIPYLYFEFLRSRETWRLMPVFHHNVLDIVTLACLTAIVPAAFRGADAQSLSRLGIKRGEDLAGIARWLLAAGEHERALELMKRAVDAALPDALLFQTLWNIALLEKKQKRPHAAVSLFTELAGCPNRYRLDALEELAKYYEHKDVNHNLALQFTEQALRLGASESLARRKARLQRYLEKPRTKQLL